MGNEILRQEEANGYVAIITVLVLLSVTTIVAGSLIFSSISMTRSEDAMRQGKQALLLTESCMEEGLLQVMRDPLFTGKNFSVPNGSCEIGLTKNGEIFTIQSRGRYGNFERVVQVDFEIEGSKLRVVSWKEE